VRRQGDSPGIARPLVSPARSPCYRQNPLEPTPSLKVPARIGAAFTEPQPLAEADIESSLAQARRQLAITLWREHAGDAGGAAFLRRRFGDVDGLRAALGDLLSHEPLLPEAGDTDTHAALQSAWHALHAAFAAHGAEARAALEQATAAKVLSRARDKAPDVDVVWSWLAAQDARVPLDCRRVLAPGGRLQNSAYLRLRSSDCRSTCPCWTCTARSPLEQRCIWSPQNSLSLLRSWSSFCTGLRSASGTPCLRY
jgi:hypothetical protein